MAESYPELFASTRGGKSSKEIIFDASASKLGPITVISETYISRASGLPFVIHDTGSRS